MSRTGGLLRREGHTGMLLNERAELAEFSFSQQLWWSDGDAFSMAEDLTSMEMGERASEHPSCE